MNYRDFTLDFVPDGRGGVAVKVADSPAGPGCLEPFEVPAVVDEVALRFLGARLFEQLFRGSVRRRFDTSLGCLRPGDGLRIKIQIDLHEPALAPLHALPWELLFESWNQHAFSLDQRFSIVRFIPRERFLDRRDLPRPLRILLACAEPRSARMLSIEDEVRRIRKAVHRPGEIEVTTLAHTSLPSLRQALAGIEEFHILHFIGHGDFDPTTGEGVLHFEEEGETRKVSLVRGPWLGDLLRDRTSLRLVFLNACHTARSTTPYPFAGVATALVQAGVPAVVAMRLPHRRRRRHRLQRNALPAHRGRRFDRRRGHRRAARPVCPDTGPPRLGDTGPVFARGRRAPVRNRPARVAAGGWAPCPGVLSPSAPSASRPARRFRRPEGGVVRAAPRDAERQLDLRPSWHGRRGQDFARAPARRRDPRELSRRPALPRPSGRE